MKFVLHFFSLFFFNLLSFSFVFAQPSFRIGESLTEMNGTIYLFGGVDSSGYHANNELWKWDASNKQWVELSPIGTLPPVRANHSVAVSSKSGVIKMYVFGGVGNGWLNDVWSYDPSENKWTQEVLTGTIPDKRRYHTTTTLSDGRIFLFGGQVMLSGKDESFIFDPSTGNWEKLNSSFPGKERMSHCAFLGSDGNPYIFGGYDENGNVVNSMYRYNLSTNTWENVTASATVEDRNKFIEGDWPKGRADAGYDSDDKYMYVAGGINFDYFDVPKELWKYNIAEGEWTKLNDLPGLFADVRTAIIKDAEGKTKGLLLFSGNTTTEVSLEPNAVNENQIVPNAYKLNQNYPNPFNPSTTISYSVPLDENRESLNVSLKVYDLLGQEVATLVNKEQAPGNYSVNFNASELNSGIYFYKMSVGNFTDSKKMILMK